MDGICSLHRLWDRAGCDRMTWRSAVQLATMTYPDIVEVHKVRYRWYGVDGLSIGVCGDGLFMVLSEDGPWRVAGMP